jgi:hypothetical protein
LTGNPPEVTGVVLVERSSGNLLHLDQPARVQLMLGMKKLGVAALEAAHRG